MFIDMDTTTRIQNLRCRTTSLRLAAQPVAGSWSAGRSRPIKRGPIMATAIPNQIADGPYQIAERATASAATIMPPKAARAVAARGCPSPSDGSSARSGLASKRRSLPCTRKSHAATHTKPAEPMTTNVIRQPYLGVRIATTSGVATAPTAAPELKMPLPRPRSAGGSTRAVTRNAHGQLNDSPTPSNARQTINQPRLGTSAVATAASDHHATAAA